MFFFRIVDKKITVVPNSSIFLSSIHLVFPDASCERAIQHENDGRYILTQNKQMLLNSKTQTRLAK
jgi:hypothetical protein